MESQYSKIKYTYASLNKKEPTPETYFGHFSLQLKCAYCLSIFLTGKKPVTGYVLDSLACSQYHSCVYIINKFVGGNHNHYIVFMHHLDHHYSPRKQRKLYHTDIILNIIYSPTSMNNFQLVW